MIADVHTANEQVIDEAAVPDEYRQGGLDQGSGPEVNGMTTPEVHRRPSMDW